MHVFHEWRRALVVKWLEIPAFDYQAGVHLNPTGWEILLEPKHHCTALHKAIQINPLVLIWMKNCWKELKLPSLAVTNPSENIYILKLWKKQEMHSVSRAISTLYICQTFLTHVVLWCSFPCLNSLSSIMIDVLFILINIFFIFL